MNHPAEPRITDAALESAIDGVEQRQRAAQARIAGSTARERIDRIRRLENAMLTHREAIREAMLADFRKPAFETDVSEILTTVSEARHASRNLRRWMRPRRVPNPLVLFGTTSRIHYEPRGRVLILSPWNFPFLLTFGPLISAIAAGNTAVLKPSELAPSSSACMKRILGGLYPDDEVALFEGDASVASALLHRPWDHIFFTGSPQVGSIVMAAAARHLTSLTLELGGKSPAIVDESADIEDAARKIVWGRTLNGGQACVAPDYALVPRSAMPRFETALTQSVEALFGSDPRRSNELCRMVNDRHFTRLRGLFDDAIAKGARIVTGGTFDETERYVAPTILADVDPSSEIMHHEIFGPILPVVPYDDLDAALERVRTGAKPLSLYIFARDSRRIARILSGTSAGGTTVNDTLLHFFQPNLPFGGVGHSGFGRAHGEHGFREMSNARGVTIQGPFELTRLLHPPVAPWVRRVFEWLMKLV